jgi:hypothetical protein
VWPNNTIPTAELGHLKMHQEIGREEVLHRGKQASIFILCPIARLRLLFFKKECSDKIAEFDEPDVQNGLPDETCNKKFMSSS